MMSDKINLKSIYSKLESIEIQINQLVGYLSDKPDKWVDGYAVMKRLGISKRTLQTYRTDGILPYSQIRGIYYYKSNDIDKMLEKGYTRKI